MITILFCTLFGLSLDGLTVQGLITWLGNHPFLTVMLLGEIFNYRVTVNK